MLDTREVAHQVAVAHPFLAVLAGSVTALHAAAADRPLTPMP